MDVKNLRNSSNFAKMIRNSMELSTELSKKKNLIPILNSRKLLNSIRNSMELSIKTSNT